MPGIRDILSTRVTTVEMETRLERPQLEAVVREARTRLAGMGSREPTPFERDTTRRQLMAVRHEPQRLSSIPRQVLKRGAWVLFEPGDDGDPPLAASLEFLKAFFDRVRKERIGAAVIAAVKAFLASYPRDQDYFDSVRILLKGLVTELDTPRGHRLRSQVEQYALLEKDGPSQFAVRIVSETGGLDELLEAGGLSGELSVKGFVEHAYEASLALVSGKLRSGGGDTTLLGRLFDISMSREEAGRQLRFPRFRSRLAESLLMPFAERSPPVVERRMIADFLLDQLGDPRTKKGAWKGVDESARAVMMSWLVEDTLEDFFRLLDTLSGTDSDLDRHWPYRKAFWMAYLRRGYIRDAWVALAPGAEFHAKRRFNAREGSYGNVSGPGVKQNHAVLIMRIGDLVITEWNHNGKYRTWHINDENAPSLYKKAYSREELMNLPSFDGSHMGSEKGSWQKKISEYIWRKTQAAVSASEYLRI